MTVEHDAHGAVKGAESVDDIIGLTALHGFKSEHKGLHLQRVSLLLPYCVMDVSWQFHCCCFYG